MDNLDNIKIKHFERLNDDLVKLFVVLNAEMNKNSAMRVKFGEDCFHDTADMSDSFIAYDKNEPIGCAILKFVSKEVGIVTNIYVAPEYRKLGLAYRLMDAAETRAKERGHLLLIGDTWNEYIPMQKAWIKAGWTEYKVVAKNKEEKAYCEAGKNYWKLIVNP